MRSTLADRQRSDIEAITAHNARVRELFDDHFPSPRRRWGGEGDRAPIEKAELCFEAFRAMSVEFGYVVLRPEFSFAALAEDLTAFELHEVRRTLSRIRDELRRRKLEDAPMLLSHRDFREFFGSRVPF